MRVAMPVDPSYINYLYSIASYVFLIDPYPLFTKALAGA